MAYVINFSDKNARKSTALTAPPGFLYAYTIAPLPSVCIIWHSLTDWKGSSAK